MSPLHICISSVLFDKKPEGICTGRLIRALLDQGHRITVLTSSKEGSSYTHPNLKKVVLSHRPRYPRAVFKLLAILEGGIYSNFYMWSKKAANYDFGGDVPDVFYGRAWPHASMVPAYQLAKKYNRSLLLHFSDPFPAPNEDIAFSAKFFSDLQKMVDASDAITFTNEETIAYQREHVSFDLNKAHVLNHISPVPATFGSPGELGHFYHVGGVGPSRSPVPLLDGFALHLKSHPESRLFFVGAHAKYVVPEVEERGLMEAVKVLPFTKDVQAVFRKAGVLISIDTLVSPPIFTPTKIVEYMVTDRPVMAITPEGSPVSKLVARSPNTAIAVTDYSPQAIAEGMAKISSVQWKQKDFIDRITIMSDYGASEIAAKFVDIVSNIK